MRISNDEKINQAKSSTAKAGVAVPAPTPLPPYVPSFWMPHGVRTVESSAVAYAWRIHECPEVRVHYWSPPCSGPGFGVSWHTMLLDGYTWQGSDTHEQSHTSCHCGMGILFGARRRQRCLPSVFPPSLFLFFFVCPSSFCMYLCLLYLQG